MKKTFTIIFLFFKLSSYAQVGIGTDNPLTGFHVADSSVLFSATGDVSLSPANFPGGEGRKMFWYADKAAFRAGYVGSFGASYWDTSNIGAYSFATGNNTRASGSSSFAAGLTTTASGAQSVALGQNSTASGTRSFAFNGTAAGEGSVAIGSGAQATGDDAVAVGPSSIAGGLASVVIGPSIANGSFAIAIGLQNSASGNFSVAIGKNARTANRQGSMVLGDAGAGFSSDSVYSTANNQMTMRFIGGYRLFTNQNLSAGVVMASGGGAWSSVSDRNKKENFRPVDKEDVLKKVAAIPLNRWNYKSQPEAQQHIGPMAQDFYAAFKLDGIGNDTTINTIDIDGINMVAIQALESRTKQLKSENEELRAQLLELSKRMVMMERKYAARRRKDRKNSKLAQPVVANLKTNRNGIDSQQQ